MNRRALLTCAAIAVAAGLTAAGSPGSQAQTFPSEPITLIVAWPAGGGSDISMRLIADALSKQIGVPVVVLNKPGAGGAIGHREIANAKPDGYTIGMFSSGGIALPYLNAQANTFDELQPIASSAKIRTPCRSAMRAASPRSRTMSIVPGQIRARSRTATISRADHPISRGALREAAQHQAHRVSYAGFGPTVIGLMAGEVNSATVPMPDTIEQHKAGKLKILGVSATERHFMAPGNPDLPRARLRRRRRLVALHRRPERHPEDRLRLLREQRHRRAERARSFKQKQNKAGFVVQPGDAKATYQRWHDDDGSSIQFSSRPAS